MPTNPFNLQIDLTVSNTFHHGEIGLEELARATMGSLIEHGQSFRDPDDDWTPMLYLAMASGDLRTESLPLSLFNSAAGKDLLANVFIPARIMEAEATAYALLLNMWAVVAPVGEVANIEEAKRLTADIRPSEHPNRKEILMLDVGDAEGLRSWTATIHRFADRPPELGPWESMKDYRAVESRFTPAIAKALNAVKHPQ